MRSILDEAARIGAGIVRSLVFAPRDPDVYYYPDSTWATAFVGGSHEFLANGARLLDARAMMHYVGTGITPAMTHAGVGVGSQYAFTARDANGDWLDGGRDYTLTLPAGIPAKTFWALDIYDPQTRSLLQTDNPYPSIHSESEGMRTEDNGDLVIDFGPARPTDATVTGSRRVPGRAGSRSCASTDHWSPGSTRPGDPETSNPPTRPITAAQGRKEQRRGGRQDCWVEAKGTRLAGRARALARTPRASFRRHSRRRDAVSGTGHSSRCDGGRPLTDWVGRRNWNPPPPCGQGPARWCRPFCMPSGSRLRRSAASSSKAVKLMIHKGALLADPHDAMEGKGRYMRAIPFQSPDEINPEVVAPILCEAATRRTEMLPS